MWSIMYIWTIPSSGQALPESPIASASNLHHHKKKKALWPRSRDHVHGRIDKSRLAEMKSSLQALAALIRDSCLSDPLSSPAWHGEYFSEKESHAGHMKFMVAASFLPRSTESSPSYPRPELSIIVNDFTYLFDDSLSVNGKIFPILPVRELHDTGIYFYPVSHEDPAEVKDPALLKQWLITAEGKEPPYLPLTRKEYLDEAILELKDEKAKAVAILEAQIPIRPADVQQAEKESYIREIRESSSKVEVEMRMRMYLEKYQTDEDYRKIMIERSTSQLNASIYLMDSLLHRWSLEELKKQAIVSVPAADFKNFEDSTNPKKKLVRINPAFFHPGMLPEKSQCFLVRWSFAPSVPEEAALDQLLSKKRCFQTFRKMLSE